MQWTNGPDPCDDNLVKGNRIETNANECVDIKEGATGNVVEENICSHQLDDNSGCFSSQSDGNTIRYESTVDCKARRGFTLEGCILNPRPWPRRR